MSETNEVMAVVTEEREVVLAFPYHELPLDTGVYPLAQVQSVQNTAILHYRDELKKNPYWRQPIGYTPLLNALNQIFVYQRTKKSGEGRLMGNLSIAFGGHVDKDDHIDDVGGPYPFPVAMNYSTLDSIVTSIVREILEETGLHVSFSYIKTLFKTNTPVIIDNKNEVGLSHVGYYLPLILDDISIQALKFSEDIKPIGWFIISDLANPEFRTSFEKEHGAVFENWSQMILDTQYP